MSHETKFSPWSILVNRFIDSGMSARNTDQNILKWTLSYRLGQITTPQELEPHLQSLETCLAQLPYIRGAVKPHTIIDYQNLALITAIDTPQGRLSPSGDFINNFFDQMGVSRNYPDFYEVVPTNLNPFLITLAPGQTQDYSSYVNIYFPKDKTTNLFIPRHRKSN